MLIKLINQLTVTTIIKPIQSLDALLESNAYHNQYIQLTITNPNRSLNATIIQIASLELQAK